MHLFEQGFRRRCRNGHFCFDDVGLARQWRIPVGNELCAASNRSGFRARGDYTLPR
jgi:hypothetical protein